MKDPKEISELYIEDILNKKNEVKENPIEPKGFEWDINYPYWYKVISGIAAQKIIGIVKQYSKNIGGVQTVEIQKASAFYDYMRKWKKETAALSSPSSIRMNRNYQKIIGLGDTIIPLILHELEKESADWFYALEMLTNDSDNPVTEEMGFKESRKAWIEWGKKRGYI